MVVLKKGGKKVCIYSCGDEAEEVSNGLNTLVGKCDVYVCASRPRIVKVVEKFCTKYNAHSLHDPFLEKTVREDILQDTANRNDAKDLFTLIKKYIP